MTRYDLCQPCGTCDDCRREGTALRLLEQVRRRKRNWISVLIDAAVTLKYADPECEQPDVQSVLRRITNMTKSINSLET